MKKWILIVVATIVVVIAAALYLGLSKLGPIITKAVNTYGPDITKTEVRLGGVDLSILSAEARLRDFYLGNPKGFQSPKAMSVGSIQVNVDESSLTHDTIIIDTIQVMAPEIVYEKVGNTDNFKDILNNVKKSANMTDKPTEDKTENQGEGKKLLIKNLIVKDSKVNLSVSMVGAEKSVMAFLPDIHMTGLGGKGGAPPAEIFEQVFALLYEQITSSAVTDIFNKELEELLGSDLEGLEKDAKEQLDTLKQEKEEEVTDMVGDKLKSLFE